MKVGDCGVAYEASGSNDIDFGIVLVHGWGCRHSDYDGVRRDLENDKDRNYRVIAVDLPGHGETPTQVLPTPSMTGFAELVRRLCRELGLRKIVLAGHSMGVRVAAEAWKLSLNATPNPTVLGVVFIDGSHYKLRPSLFAFDKGDPRSAGMSEEEKAAKKTEAFQRMFSPSTPQAFKASTLAHIARMDKDYSDEVRDSMISYDGEQMETTVGRLGKEGTPFLNIQSSDIGPDNQRIPMQEGEKSRWMVYLEETVPQIKGIVVADSAHFPQVDRPEVIARAIHEFVEEVR